MTFRAATAADRPAIEGFLLAHVETSMFPLANLARHGMAGGHPRAMRFWIAGLPPVAVLGATEDGMVLPQVPTEHAGKAAKAVVGQRVLGLLGEGAQVAALRGAMGLGEVSALLDREEPLFSLALAGLRMPSSQGLALAPLSAAPRDLLLRWRTAYGREALGWAEDAEAQAERDINGDLAQGQHRVLLRHGEPVTMTGFNARLPGIVQVGGSGPRPSCGAKPSRERRWGCIWPRRETKGPSARSFSRPARWRRVPTVPPGFQEIGRFTLLIFAEPQEVRPA